jgi:undecaprenyl-diphosphatase
VTAIRRDLSRLDGSVYAAVAGTPTPNVDVPLRGLTGMADHSRLWLGIAGVLAVAGGSRGRRAALDGIASVGVASLLVNQGFKRAGRRNRPDRDRAQVPEERRVPLPTSTSFPSGHSASAYAFAEGVARSMPLAGPPLRLTAAAVAYSRVHSGVHFPGDVLAGSAIGAGCGRLVPRVLDRTIR